MYIPYATSQPVHVQCTPHEKILYSFMKRGPHNFIAPTKQANPVADLVVLHEKFIAAMNMFVQIPMVLELAWGDHHPNPVIPRDGDIQHLRSPLEEMRHCPRLHVRTNPGLCTEYCQQNKGHMKEVIHLVVA